VRLIRRNGTVVPWNESKIEIACRKAFLTTKEDAESAIKIARAVTGRVRRADQAFVHIEDVQDMVQEELMRQGFYKVAENYILYRAQRAASRGGCQTCADAERESLWLSLRMAKACSGMAAAPAPHSVCHRSGFCG
jgi:ribonucleoside-diphosphate reductase alpha chain